MSATHYDSSENDIQQMTFISPEFPGTKKFPGTRIRPMSKPKGNLTGHLGGAVASRESNGIGITASEV